MFQLARLIQFFSMFVSGFAIGFVRGWELALVMLCVVPPLGLVGTVMFTTLSSLATQTQKNTAAAGGVAEVGGRFLSMRGRVEGGGGCLAPLLFPMV